MKINKIVKSLVILLVIGLILNIFMINSKADDNDNLDLITMLNGETEKDEEEYTDLTSTIEKGNEKEQQKENEKEQEQPKEEPKKEETKTGSTYDTTSDKDLSKAGIEDWNLAPIAIGLCVLSALYAIKKIKDYQNI